MRVIDAELTRILGAVSEQNETITTMIELLSSLSNRARQEGLLALEDEIPNLAPPYLQLGVQLVVDGTDPDEVRHILYVARHGGSLSDEEIVLRLVIEEGVLGIQAGYNPRILKTRLAAYLGEAAASRAAME